MTNPFEDILKTQTTGYARRLPLDEACGYYAALRDGVTQPIVAAASGLSRDCTAAAGERGGGQPATQKSPPSTSPWAARPLSTNT